MKNNRLIQRLINRHLYRWEKKPRYVLRNKNDIIIEKVIKTRSGKVVLIAWRYTYYHSHLK
jgi:hypothetical protein